MKNIKYFIQFILILVLFILYKFLGLKIANKFSGYIMQIIGPFFRSKVLIENNLKKALPNLSLIQREKIIKRMWFNYGKILSEYAFMKYFRKNIKLSKKIKITNAKLLEKIKYDNEPVIFVSGHFNNFELMAMCLDNFGIKIATIYRPLNNFFLNTIMERIRKKYICFNQIKKGMSGMRLILKEFKKKKSIALMIDQRVSQGIRSNFFNLPALTTTIPAQFVKKYNAKIVPIYIERDSNDDFNLKIYDPIIFSNSSTIQKITDDLNILLEKMIIKNLDQWIWTHNRWK